MPAGANDQIFTTNVFYRMRNNVSIFCETKKLYFLKIPFLKKIIKSTNFYLSSLVVAKHKHKHFMVTAGDTVWKYYFNRYATVEIWQQHC